MANAKLKRIIAIGLVLVVAVCRRLSSVAAGADGADHRGRAHD